MCLRVPLLAVKARAMFFAYGTACFPAPAIF
jgi:hypothetical protein